MNTVEARKPIIDDLIDLNRNRVAYLKSSIKVGNQMRAAVARNLGYKGGDTPKEERPAFFTRADEVVEAVREGAMHPMKPLIDATLHTLDLYDGMVSGLNKQIEKAARKLPAVKWVNQKDQDGFSERFFGIVIGECGDLANYSGPYKLYARMALKPYTSRGMTHSGATWRSDKRKSHTLSAAEWEEFGYNPRRRSLGYLIAEQLIRNGANAFGKGQPSMFYRYYKRIKDEISPANPDHADWTPKHHDNHARLLTTKLLLKDLWAYWNGKPLTADMPAYAAAQ